MSRQEVRMSRQEVQLKKRSKLIAAKHPDTAPRIHRTSGYLSVNTAPIAQIIAGATPEAPTRSRWSGAAGPAGIPAPEHDECDKEHAAAFADPMASVQLLFYQTPAAEQSLAFVNERAGARAARWTPSVYLTRSYDDYRDWMERTRGHLCLPRGQASPDATTRLGLNGEQIDDDAIPRAIARLAVTYAVNIGPASINEARAPVHPSYNACNMSKAAIAAARRASRGMEDSVAYMARATLAATQTRHSLRFLRQRLSARFGSAVCGWRRALGAGGRLLAFGRLREACKTLKCQDQIMEYWSELDASYGGCISLFELDPEGTALLARLRERLLTSAGSADPAEMHRQLAVLGQAREGAPLSAAEFRAAARVLGFSATEAERLFAHLDTGGGGPSEEPGWVTAVDVAWLKRLPSLVDLGALALSPGEGAAGLALRRALRLQRRGPQVGRGVEGNVPHLRLEPLPGPRLAPIHAGMPGIPR
ncbi:unnamed protein product [Prorocentrum cordatum]|uniref:Uncharacterized protein n=1 Tax=Prorocentrum cordatum TaxID=2364126 RepID=A0ABN9YAZ2_9DINO|nr:unnamed protein product [Polarella glacialis]